MENILQEKDNSLKDLQLQQEFPCRFCSGLADRIVYYYKYDDGTPSCENPILSCAECSDEAHQTVNQTRGGCEGTGQILFTTIAQMPVRVLGMTLLAGRKGNVNHLGWSKMWRRKVNRIHFRFQKPKGE